MPQHLEPPTRRVHAQLEAQNVAVPITQNPTNYRVQNYFPVDLGPRKYNLSPRPGAFPSALDATVSGIGGSQTPRAKQMFSRE